MKTGFTIVSKNYFSFAKVLAESFKKHHRDWDFIIILVDRNEGHIQKDSEDEFELIELLDVPLPSIGSLIYRYTILELNTAVKPFIFEYLFKNQKYEKVAYIDPDILFLNKFSEVEEGLQHSDICVTPHLRRPFYDDCSPSDVNILQSGTYNFGFVAMRNTPRARALVDWWMEKLFLDCIVDIPNGLFVDQKWMDMAPTLVDKATIIRNPGYNAAYWNLHERPLTFKNKRWFAGESELVFFHFSGYSPFLPYELSKHQNRHDLKYMPETKRLCDVYGKLLLDAEYDKTSQWSYSFGTLPNGIELPLGLVRDCLQWLLRNGVNPPDPLEKPSEFCEFLVTPGNIPALGRISAVQYFLLKRRPDVANAFPEAIVDPDDVGFWSWVEYRGKTEEKLGKYFSQKRAEKETKSDVELLFDAIIGHQRWDVLNAFLGMWSKEAELQKFASWAANQAPLEDIGVPKSIARDLLESRFGPAKCLNLYFGRYDLQKEFKDISNPDVLEAFRFWLRGSRNELNFSYDEIEMFYAFCRTNKALINKLQITYKIVDMDENGVSISTFKEKALNLFEPTSPADLFKTLSSTEKALLVLADARSTRQDCESVLSETGVLSNFLKPRDAFHTASEITDHVKKYEDKSWINFAGFLSAKTGMGESARSNLQILKNSGANISERILPNTKCSDMIQANGRQFGLHVPYPEYSFVVANADTSENLKKWLPKNFWGKKNIGYWVWETEKLPLHLMNSSDLFDEIWTPSTYSANAIRATTDKTVRILPHTIPIDLCRTAKPAREKWGLPEDKTLYGFFFDPKSVLERKNVSGLIDAFLSAVRKDDNCILVLKSNEVSITSLEYEKIKTIAKENADRVMLLETTLDRNNTFSLMKSLDCYLSLHRSEGFGLSCAEAMACGLPVIATGYSGNMDFMDSSNSFLVETTKVTTDRPFGPYPAGSIWGQPNQESAVEGIRKLLNRDKREELSTAGLSDIKKFASVDRLSELVRTFLV